MSILREDNRVNLSIFLTAGFPDMKTSQALLKVLANHPAVSFVELGMPFSDPQADGATIQVRCPHRPIYTKVHFLGDSSQFDRFSAKRGALVPKKGY